MQLTSKLRTLMQFWRAPQYLTFYQERNFNQPTKTNPQQCYRLKSHQLFFVTLTKRIFPHGVTKQNRQ